MEILLRSKSLKNCNNNTNAFFALLRAGLWEKEARLLECGDVNFPEIYDLAAGQSVVGLLAAGLEHVNDVKPPQTFVLNIVGETLQIEQRNKEMNDFIALLIARLQNEGISALLVKGQGIAQCYERPMWRSSGDIDLLLDRNNYESAKKSLKPLAVEVEKENVSKLHCSLNIDSWIVELHGTMRSGISQGFDQMIDKVQADTFENKRIREWHNGKTNVPLPDINNDIIFVFTHILQHYFWGGIGLRQICDWCRLLWTYHSSIDVDLLEARLTEMKAMTEWRTFAAYAVNLLGYPEEEMPLFDSSEKWKRKAYRVNDYVMKVGNFGRNRDMSYISRYPYLLRKVMSFMRATGDLFNHFIVFPRTTIAAMRGIVVNGTKAVFEGR